MSHLITLALKDLRLVGRDKMGMFFILAFPIAIGLFIGSTMRMASSGSAKLRIAVVDEDNSEVAAKFIESLRANDKLDVIALSRDEAMERVRKGSLVGLIAIPPGFGETAGVFWQEGPALQIGCDPSRAAEAGMMQGMVMQAVGELAFSRFQNPEQMRPLIADTLEQINADENMPAPMRPVLRTLMGSLDQFVDELDDMGNADGEEGQPDAAANGTGFQLVNIEEIDITRQPKNPLAAKLRSRWDISFPQAMMWAVLGCCAGFAITVVRERQQGTMLRLQVAPLPRYIVLGGKALACFLAVLGVIVVIFLLGFGLGLRPRSYGLFGLASLSVSICFVGVMMLMSMVGRTEEAVGGAAWGANFIMSMLGGGMVPLAVMPDFMRTMSHASPVKWGILAIEGAVWRGFSLQEMAFPCTVLVVIGLATMGLALALMNRARG